MEQKEIAIQCLEKLDIYKPYIRKFKSKAGIPCFFENFGGFYVDQEPEIWNKVKEVEKENGGLVYALTHEQTSFGECWSMLYVPKDCETVEEVLDPINSKDFYVFAYVWNKDDDWCSEFGDIVVRSFGGGIKRIG
jgi:hypothetical protein